MTYNLKSTEKYETTNILPNEVHIWCIRPSELKHAVSDYINVLSKDEIKKANSYVFEKDKVSYIISRSALRNILGDYLGVAPKEISFSYGKNGKPYLSKRQSTISLEFNASHSKGVTLIAFTTGKKVGIDIEKIQSMEDVESLAKTTLSGRELEEYGNIGMTSKLRVFFDYWTHKEAFVKATGRGLTNGTDYAEFSFCPKEKRLTLARVGGKKATKRWSSFKLKYGNDYAGALFVPAGSWNVRCFDWTHTAEEAIAK